MDLLVVRDLAPLLFDLPHALALPELKRVMEEGPEQEKSCWLALMIPRDDASRMC